MITWENYEEYMMLYVDEELDHKEQKALMDFMKLHPELREELKSFQATKFVPDMSQVYAGKEGLLKSTQEIKSAGRVIDLRQWWIYGAAAGIIAIVLFTTLKNTNSEVELPSVAKEVSLPEQKPVIPESKISEPVPFKQEVKPVNSIADNKGVHSNTGRSAREHPGFEKIGIVAMKPVTHETLQIQSPELIEAPEISILAYEPETETEGNKGFFARLPVNYERSEGLKTLKQSVDNKIEQAKNIAGNLKDTEVAFKIGNKELFVINF